MTELDQLATHAETLFDLDTDGRLLRVNEDDGDPPPRLFLVRGRQERLIWFRHDVPAATLALCTEIADRLPSWDGAESDGRVFEPVRRALQQDAPIESEEHGPAFRFGDRVEPRGGGSARLIDQSNAHLLDRFSYTRSHLEAQLPVVGVVLDGSVVSVCRSVRTRPTACEAGVDTDKAYRGRGLAPVVVVAWRDAVEVSGRQPLYSTSWTNAASLAVARKLRLVAYADTFSLD